MHQKLLRELAHYILCLKNQGKEVEAQACYKMVMTCHHNPKFDQGKFDRACGMDTPNHVPCIPTDAQVTQACNSR